VTDPRPGSSTDKWSPRRTRRAGDEPAPDPDEAELAVAFYNDQADQHRYRRCPKLTVPLRKDLAERLKDIGGLENFKRCVLAVQLDAWMAGRKAGKDGFFKLDIAYLLKTKGRDVLAHLLALADDAVLTERSADRAQAKQDAMLEEIKRQQALDDERDRMERGE
jgi:hypothetical protein